MGDTATSERPVFDPGTANAARVWDYLLGGKDNFRADRDAVAAMVDLYPEMPAVARNAEAFRMRAVGRLAKVMGVKQFIDLGAGLPEVDGNYLHDLADDLRVVYVDHDPVVVRHGLALLAGERSAYIDADIRVGREVLNHKATRRLINRAQPVGVLACGVLDLLPEPGAVIAWLRRSLPSESYIVVTHAEWTPETEAVAEIAGGQPRTREEILTLLDRLPLAKPGLVPVHEWWPAESMPAVPMLGAVARVP